MKRLLWLSLIFLGAWDPVTRKQTDVAKGNEQMKAGKPAEAEKLYQRALGELPSNPGVLYDLGVAHYAAAQAMPAGPDRQKLLETASQELRLAGDAPETGLRASAHYNLGNTLFAEQKYKDAIEEYKKALRLEPSREDARHNLELALAKLPPPNPQQPPPQQQGSQDDQKKPQAGQSPEPSPPSDDQKDQNPQPQEGQSQAKQEPQPQQNQPGQQPQKGDEQKGPEPKAGDKPDDKDQQKQQQASAGTERAGDKDMDRKLDLLEDRSKDMQVQKATERARERHRTGPVKDW